jgi:TusA-related sulfurtransferase/DNA-binding transcriptional ArsR family regulator
MKRSDLVELFKVLANQKRLDILTLLLDSCLTVNEVAQKLGINISTAYRYLTQMYKQGILSVIKTPDGDRFDFSSKHMLRVIEEAINFISDKRGTPVFEPIYYNDTNLFKPKRVLDFRGETCPIPELTTRRELKELTNGETLLVIVDYPLSKERIISFCRKMGYKVIAVDDKLDSKIYIEKTV